MRSRAGQNGAEDLNKIMSAEQEYTCRQCGKQLSDFQSVERVYCSWECICLASLFPTNLWCGPELVLIYTGA